MITALSSDGIVTVSNITSRHPINTRTTQFFESEEGVTLRKELLKMAKSEQYNTRSMYSTHDQNGLSFVDKHMKYMSLYPNLNRFQYVLNLKLMTKKR